jgi:RimJ/RimL family protein N-acetyltransferase
VTVPTLTTARLILSDVLAADPVAYRRNFNDYDVIGDLADAVPWPYPPDGVLTFFETLRPEQGKSRWAWAIYLKSGPTDPIGNVDLRRVAPENRGFWLARQHWGQGYMTEAASAVTDYAFENLGFETLILSNALGNYRSRRIKEKAGAVLLRTEPAAFVSPAYTHREVWELTKETWQSRRADKISGCHGE